jgi:hypothetical protein
MRKAASYVALAALLVTPLAACGGSSSTSTSGDLTLSQVFQDLGPAICNKFQSCAPAAYQAGFPNGLSDCLAAFDNGDTNPNEVTTCTTAQANQCASDFKAEPCAEIISDGGALVMPFALPPSCNGC